MCDAVTGPIHTAAASAKDDVNYTMKKLLTLGLTLALSGILGQPLQAKSKDNDKKHGEKSSKSEKKNSASRPVVLSSQRQRGSVPQRSVVIEQRDERASSNQSRSRGSSHDDGRYSNHNDSHNDRGWSRHPYYHAPSHAYRGWDRGRNYSWNNHSYRWYGGSWVIVTPRYDYTGYSGYRTSGYSSVSRSEVRDVQILLTRRGYSPGPIDGDMGYRTQRAIQQFQSDSGLPVTGRIDRNLLAALDRG